MGQVYGTVPASHRDRLAVVKSSEHTILTQEHSLRCLLDVLSPTICHTFGSFISMAGGLKDWKEMSVMPLLLLQMKVELDTSPC